MLPRALAVILCASFAVAAPSGQGRPDSPPAVADEILIEFKPHATDDRREAAIASVGGKRIKRFKQLRIDHVSVPRGRRAEDTIAELLQRDEVAAAQPNYARRATFPAPPNDPFWTANNVHLWGIERIQADDVWSTYT